jgi:hypothetical protein
MLCEWKRIYAGFSSFANICIAVGNPVMKMGMTGPGFPTPYVLVFLCSVSSVKLNGDCSFHAAEYKYVTSYHSDPLNS